jgi:hypothetical protein
VTWEIFGSFVEKNGTISREFLQFATVEDFSEGFSAWNVEQLNEFCKANGWSRSM